MRLFRILRRQHKIHPKSLLDAPLARVHSEKTERKSAIIIDDLDEVAQIAPQVSFTGRQLWNSTRLIRENRNFRRSHGACVIGGAKAIERIWREYKIKPNVVYVPNTEPTVPAWCLKEELPSCIVRCSPVDINKKLLSAEYGDGHAAEFPLPAQLPLEAFLGEGKQARLKSMLVLVGLRIPSNIGVLIRGAADLGFDSVLLEDCADVLHEKVLRASEGFVFSPRLKVFETSRGASAVPLLEALAREHSLLPLLAVPSQRAESAAAVAGRLHAANAARRREAGAAPGGPLLVLGSEARGLDRLAGEWAGPHHFVSVPLPNPSIDSVNVSVAGAVLMHLFRPKGEEHFAKLQQRHMELGAAQQKLLDS